MNTALPVRLETEPLIDVIFELRFEASVGAASNMLPGILLPALPGDVEKAERQGLAEIPSSIRDTDPNLRYLPLLRLVLPKHFVSVGDRSISIAARLPYEGWAAFKPVLLKVITCLQESALIKRVERVSLRYSDLIEKTTTSDQLAALRFNILLGSHTLADVKNLHLRAEIAHNDCLHIVQVATEAQVNTPVDSRNRSGLVVDTDTIFLGSYENIWTRLSEILDNLHNDNKKLFFDLLTELTLSELKPVYE